MSYASALRTFIAQSSNERRQIYPVVVAPVGKSTQFAGSKAPTRISRVQQEQGAGWVQRAIATFYFSGTGDFRPAIGVEFAIVTTATKEEVNTKWRCFDLIRADDNTGDEHRCVCFRLD